MVTAMQIGNTSTACSLPNLQILELLEDLRHTCRVDVPTNIAS
jgi:hypothetical protein